MARRYYRPNYQTESPLARALSGALAVWTGQQQGRQAREMQDEEDARRDTVAATQHLMQLSQMERQSFDQDQDRYKMMLSLPNQTPESQQAVVQQMLKSRYTPTDITPTLQQLQGRKRGQRVNVQYPQFQRPQQGAGGPQLSFLPPGQREAFEAPISARDRAIAQGVATPGEGRMLADEREALVAARDKGLPIEKAFITKYGGLPLQVNPALTVTKAGAQDQMAYKKRIEDATRKLDAYVALGGPPEGKQQRAAEVGKWREVLGTTRFSTRDDLDKADALFRSADFASVIAGIDRRQAEWEQNQAAKVEGAEKTAKAKVVEGMWSDAAKEVTAALAAKSPERLRLAIAKQRKIAEDNPQYADGVYDPGFDTTRQQIAYKKPILPAVLTAEDLDQMQYEDAVREETDAELKARVFRESADLFRKEDPAVAFKSAQDAVGQEWAIVKDPNADEASRIEAMRHIQELAEKYPGLSVPKTLPKFAGSPWVRKQLELSQLRLLQDLRKYDDDQRKRDVDYQIAQKRLAKMDLESAKLVADIAKAQRAGVGALTDLDKEFARTLGEAHKEALDEYQKVRNLKPEDRPEPVEWMNRLMVLRKNLTDAETKRMEFLRSKGNVEIPQGSAPPPGVPQGPAPKQRVRGKVNKMGFDDFDMMTIKALQGAGLSFEAAANRVRADNGGK